MKRSFLILISLLFAVSLASARGAMERLRPSPYFLGMDTKTVTNAWESYFQQSFEWYCQDNHWKWMVNEAGGDPAAQITQSRQMINSGVKGLIISAQDKEAAKPIVDFATAAKIPVFTADADIDSPNVKMYVGFSGERAGSELALKMVDYLKSKYHGRVRGTVLEMMGPLGGASSIDRSKGFHDVIDRYPQVRVIKAVGDFQEAPAKTAAENVLRAYPRIDACYSANGPMATGAVEAMKDLSIDPTKVYTVTIDATPSVLPLIKSGDIQAALDQAPAFYTAIAAHYLVEYMKKGDAGLPKVGDTITAQDLKLSTGVQHAGTDIWGDNSSWAPAKVVKGLAGHLWFQTGAILVTKDNADAPYLWANVKLPGKA